MKKTITLFALLLFAQFAFGTTLKGKIKDAVTNEPLVGATIVLKDTKLGSAAGFDGTFEIKNVPVGSYDVTISYIGYEAKTQKIEVSQDNQTLNFDLTETARQLAETVVSARADRESDRNVRKSEQKSDIVVNMIGARAIELLPDVTVGNVLQRISGVSVTRSSSGDGQYAIIRGMSQRYNYTAVNGVILPSPDDKNRSVPLDIFPADMIERIEVVKTLTPSMEGSAIAGATNMVMKNAPDKLVISGNVSTGVNSIFFDRPFSGFNASGTNFKAPSETNPTGYVATTSDFSVKKLNFTNAVLPINSSAAISIGNRVFNKKLGFLIAGSFSNQYRGSNTLFYDQVAISTDPTPNSVHLLSYQNRQYSLLQTRTGLHAKFDFSIAPNHSIIFYNLFLQLDENQHRAYDKNGIRPNNGPGEIDYFDRVAFSRKNLYNTTLKGTDKFSDNLSADWTLAYSLAKSTMPDWIDFSTFKDSANAKTLYVSPTTHNWNRSQDEDKAGYLNLVYTPTKNAEIKVGGMYRYKDRSAFYQSYKAGVIAPGGLARQPFTDVNSVQFGFYPASGGLGVQLDPQNYAGTEGVGAAYVEGKITILKNLSIVGGLRVETTDQKYVSLQTETVSGKTGDIHYTDVLPSLNLKYTLTTKQNLRLSYFSGISRATLYELVPATTAGDYYSVGGNPYLKHTTSQNFDFRYENFFTPTDHFMAGVFYKNITNPIETAFYFSGDGQTLTYGSSNPSSGATNYGLEVVFVKFFRKLGISGNYTYTHSRVTTPKQLTPAPVAGSVSTFPNQTRPLQGQADHIGNLALLFKDAKSGFDAQLSFVYTGERINIVNGYYNLDYWQRATSQLDFSAEKKIKKHFSVFLKATNLLNNAIYYDLIIPNKSASDSNLPSQSNPDKVLIQRDEFNQSFLVGVRFKL
jgi:hypothetical protein